MSAVRAMMFRTTSGKTLAYILRMATRYRAMEVKSVTTDGGRTVAFCANLGVIRSQAPSAYDGIRRVENAKSTVHTNARTARNQ